MLVVSTCYLFVLCFEYHADVLKAVFPGLVESIDDKNWDNAKKWVDIIEDCLKNAAKSLE